MDAPARPSPLRALGLALGVVLALAARAPGDGLADTGADFVDPRVLELDPVDTRTGYPGRVVVSGRIHEGYSAPAVIVIRPDGRAVEVRPVEVALPAFRAEVVLGEGRGVYRIEVRATTQRDLTHSGARMRVFAGIPPDTPDAPEPPDEAPDPTVPPAVLEARFFALVNGHRERAGLEPFTWLEPLAVAARLHAQAAVKEGWLDHRVDGGGNLAQRLMRLTGWGDILYSLPPSRPAPQLGARSYVAAANDARRSLDLILYRWQRFAAFCLPMTSPDVPHAACAVARAKSGDLFVVFGYAQLNAPSILANLEAWPAAIGKEYRAAEGGEARARLLREWGGWRVPAALAEARKRLQDADPQVRAAAHDVLLLVDERAARERLARAGEALRAAVAQPSRAAAAREAAAWLAALRNAPDVAAEAAEALRRLDAASDGAAQPGSPAPDR